MAKAKKSPLTRNTRSVNKKQTSKKSLLGFFELSGKQIRIAAFAILFGTIGVIGLAISFAADPKFYPAKVTIKVTGLPSGVVQVTAVGHQIGKCKSEMYIKAGSSITCYSDNKTDKIGPIKNKSHEYHPIGSWEGNTYLRVPATPRTLSNGKTYKLAKPSQGYLDPGGKHYRVGPIYVKAGYKKTYTLRFVEVK